LINVSKEHKNDEKIVLARVTQNRYVLKYASEKLRNTYEIILATATQNKHTLEYASGGLRDMKWVSLEHMHDEMKKNVNIVLAAVKQYIDALKYA
jgi:coenzyme F420-reducing hydrogenase alpha subunit